MKPRDFLDIRETYRGKKSVWKNARSAVLEHYVRPGRSVNMGTGVIAGSEVEGVADIALAQIVDLLEFRLEQRRIARRVLRDWIRYD
jgi:hypothetical protein